MTPAFVQGIRSRQRSTRRLPRTCPLAVRTDVSLAPRRDRLVKHLAPELSEWDTSG